MKAILKSEDYMWCASIFHDGNEIKRYRCRSDDAKSDLEKYASDHGIKLEWQIVKDVSHF